MSLFILTDTLSAGNTLIAELRDKGIQSDRLRFRRNMERIGELLAYEISKKLSYEETSVETPLDSIPMKILKENPYLITILRAGIPFYQGFLNLFDRADSGFIGAFRSEQDEDNHFDIEMGYTAIGNVDQKEVILVDPMLATGKSIIKAIRHILKYGSPAKIHVAAIIASTQGYQEVKNNVNLSVDFWFGSVDDKLDENSYIVPGLGDAGDLCFGHKR